VYGFSRDRSVAKKIKQRAAEQVRAALSIPSVRVLRMMVDEVVSDAEPTLNL
jgi:hypothetical protein